MAHFDSMRKDSFVGMMHVNDDPESGVHVAEWWNGEGLDFTVQRKDQPDLVFGLHLDELAAVVAAAFAIGMVDREECDKRVSKMLEKMERKHGYE